MERKHIILLLILLIAVYWKWWVSGEKVAIDFPVVSQSDLIAQFNFPQAWFSRGSIGLGGYSVFTLWSWPMDFIAGILSKLGLSFGILERIMFVIPTLIVGVYSLINLLKSYGLSKSSQFGAAFFYLANTYILLLIDGGQLGIGLAYAMFPASYSFFIKAVDGGLKEKVISGLSLFILGIFDVRFLYILGLLLTIQFVFFGWTFKWIRTAIISLIIFIGLNSYWILPFVKYPLSSQTFSNLTQASNLNFTQIKNSVSLLQPHWYENIFGKIPPFKKEFLLIPILAFLAPILRRKDKLVWFWTTVSIVSIFLAKGANPPFSGFYPWVFDHFPGFSLFRDSSKFFFLISLSYSILIAFTMNEVIKRFPKLKLIFPAVVLIYVLFLANPAYLGKMTGTFSEPRYKDQYEILENIIKNDQDFGKVFWVPSRPPLGFASRTHAVLEANRMQSLRPFAISTVGTYETQNFIREGIYMGELFDVLGIKYISYPYFDPMRDDTRQEKVDYYNAFLSQISKLPWIKEKVSPDPLPVFSTGKNKDKFFLSSNTYFVLGSDKIYHDIVSLGGKFADNAMVFAEESPELISNIFKVPQAKTILHGKDKLDLALSFLPKESLIFPSVSLGTSPSVASSSLGWWSRSASDLIWWRDFLQTKYGVDNLDFDYGGGWSIAEGDRELTVQDNRLTKGKILFARVMKSSKSGSVEFFQNSVKIGSVDTKIIKPQKVKTKLTGHDQIPDKEFTYDQADFIWVNVGTLVAGGNIEIKTHGEINVINALASLDQKAFNELSGKVETLYRDDKVIEWKKLDDVEKSKLFKGNSDAKVAYDEISPTHYKIAITGMNGPATLVFSDTYDSLWNIDGSSPYRLFSIINGFQIGKDGVYDLYFKPQQYVYPGLVVSVITLTSCIMFLVWRKKQS